MGLVSWMKGIWKKMFRKEIEKKFDAEIQVSDIMEGWIGKFYNITSGRPYWLDPEDDIKSINFAGFIDDVTANLVTLDLGIEMPNNPRGKYLQEQADYVLQVIKDKVSEGLGNCGIIFKPNGVNTDYVMPGNFVPTETNSNGDILGCIFRMRVTKDSYTYTRYEWHRFEEINGEKVYKISNRCFKRKGTLTNADDSGSACPLTEVPEWAHLQEETEVRNIDKPLFSYFKNPVPNRYDRSSVLGVPIWENALEELKDLDIAWSRKTTEVEDSKHVTFVDESTILFAKNHDVKLPRYINGIDMGINGGENSIHEHVSTLLTEQRIDDINSILNMISTKCGFSQGFFSMDGKDGVRTATEVEADDQQTINTINGIHTALKNALLDLFYAINKIADDKMETPAVDWEEFKEQIVISYHDFTANPDEDRARALQLTREGFYSKIYYLVNYEGFSEDEARKVVEEANGEQEQNNLFSEE